MPKKQRNTQEKFVETCVAALRSSGGRVTKPRLAVVQAVSAAQTPLTAREVYESVAEDSELGTIDLVTVYRVLETFEELGLVHQVFPSGGYLPCFHSGCGSAMHILIRCSSCEDIEELDVPQETIAPMLWYLRGSHGFSPDEHLFQINGTCSSCTQS